MIGEYRKTLVDGPRQKAWKAAIDYAYDKSFDGEIVEVGCYKAGLLEIACKQLATFSSGMKVYGFDIFESMPAPGKHDGNPKKENWELAPNPIENARALLAATDYPHWELIKGDVLETTKKFEEPISVLRIDVDWYEPTLAALENLYPLLVQGGVLLIDDYGHWEGCRKAVDEFFKGSPQMWFWQDYTGVGTIKL